MNYPIEVLRTRIEKHKAKLNDDLSSYETVLHEGCIKQLEIAIEKLLLY